MCFDLFQNNFIEVRVVKFDKNPKTRKPSFSSLKKVRFLNLSNSNLSSIVDLWLYNL